MNKHIISGAYVGMIGIMMSIYFSIPIIEASGNILVGVGLSLLIRGLQE